MSGRLGSGFNAKMWYDFWGQVLTLKYGPTFGDQNLTGDRSVFHTGVSFSRVVGSLINGPGSVFNVKNLSIYPRVTFQRGQTLMLHRAKWRKGISFVMLRL